MNIRSQITFDPETQRRARAKAAELGISFAEYVRRTVINDLGERKPEFDITTMFDIIKDGPPTDIARDKDKMIGEAVWKEYLRKTGRASNQSRRRRRSG